MPQDKNAPTQPEMFGRAEKEMAKNKSLQELVGDNIDVLPLKLRDIEFDILSVFLEKGRGAFAVRGIQKILQMKAVYSFLQEVVEPPKIEDGQVKFVMQGVLNRLSDRKMKVIAFRKEMNKKEEQFIDDFVKDYSDNGEKWDNIEETLKQKIMASIEKTPSYDKIIGALLSLESLDLVSKRSEGREGAKSKVLWTLNEHFYLIYLKRRREIIDDLQRQKTMEMIYRLYPRVILEFYDIPLNAIRAERWKEDFDSMRKL